MTFPRTAQELYTVNRKSFLPLYTAKVFNLLI